jgi:hypothetical protein
MIPEQQVPTFRTCVALRDKGFARNTHFHYVKGNGNDWTVRNAERLGSSRRKIRAPTAQELLSEFSTMILKDGEIDEDIADSVDDLVLHYWTEDNLAQLLAELWPEVQKEAEAEAARIVVLSHSSLGVVKKVQEAILNAEVKV